MHSRLLDYFTMLECNDDVLGKVLNLADSHSLISYH